MTRKAKPPPLGDGWYESEEPTRLGMIAELQRIRRRTAVRPLPVIALALLITAGITYKVATKKRLYTADIVLAVSEGAMSSTRDSSIPFEQLREYVFSVLLPDSKLTEIIERRFPGRISKVGVGFALETFRDRIQVFIWKNSFVYYHQEDTNTQKSARVGIEVTDEDPEVAHEVARELADIAIQTHNEQRRKLSVAMAGELAEMRETVAQKLDDFASAISLKNAALTDAKKRGNNGLAAGLIVELATLRADEKRAQLQLSAIAASPEAVADRVTAARLDTTITIVDDVPAQHREQSGMVLAMIIAVIGVGSLLGSALVLGAFDSRVHETDDVARLDLPVLGHLPGFQGDHVGSLRSRSATRARVPSFIRWRSHR